MSSEWSRKRGRQQGEEKSGDERGSESKQSSASAAGPAVATQPTLQPPPRYPTGRPPPEAYYQPMYPPTGEGNPYPPPRGYENPPPPPHYGMPPYGHPPMSPYMPPYPPYQHHPMYPPHPYPQHPHPAHMAAYGGAYPPEHGMPPNMTHRYPEVVPPPPYPGAPIPPPPPTRTTPSSAAEGSAGEREDRKPAARGESIGDPPSAEGGDGDDGDEDDDDEDKSSSQGQIVPGAVTARLKTYIKPRVPTTQDVLDRRSRKNAQSRSRASKLRSRIAELEHKPPEERTEEENQIWAQYEARRQRKNDRSRERAIEKKEEIDRILNKPEKQRTKIEKQFLETALGAKKRKNEGDRLRRQRLKQLGLKTKGTGVKPGISARGPLPPQYQGAAPVTTFGSMADIPMSPLPSGMPPHHHHHPHHPPPPPHHLAPGVGAHMGGSPGTFGSPGSAGMPHYPSPHLQQQRPPAAAAPGVLETPGRSRAEQPLSFIPPSQAASYDSGGGAASAGDRVDGDPNAVVPRGQLHMIPSSSRVEQRRNPDGSMSISIGRNSGNHGGSSGGPPFGGEVRMNSEEPNMSDVSHLLLYDNGDGEDNGVGGAAADGDHREDQQEDDDEEDK